ncbi:hypothetical protein FSP39_014628 [Pinctada imbricata]|uniref:AIG1-type G domain-containing protein n=1 Tax=Pinctada imbricata TaxID=66713 RepID=A0AA89BKK3_PINIB|nr:hypothetical protein FSP39_014628 [Pinctada imbricata]
MPSSIFITGANRGIGLEFVKQFTKFAPPPKHIFATCRNPSDAKMSVTFRALTTFRQEVEKTLEGEGLNVLINNAGVISRTDINQVTPELMLENFKINTMGPLFLVKSFLPLLQKAASSTNGKDFTIEGAAIINITTDSNYIPSADEKTILLLGCTGCGKSTLIDSFANYLVGAESEGFHFKMVRLEKCEEDNAKDKTQSLTEWITSYVIVPSKATEDRLGFTINIVDTPGFCDTRGHDRDIEVIEQITTFFERKEKLRKSLEAICFIFKASDTRLTPSQRYVCDTIMGLFGKDIKPNICILTTFSDVKPKVLELLKKVDIPCDTYFEFNNVGKQETSCSGPKSKLHTQFLEMNNENFKLFLNHVSILPSQNLKLTLDVLDIRKKIECITDHLDDSIQRALSDIRVFQQEIKVFEEHKSQIEKKKDFSYQVDAYVVEEKPIDTEVEYQATNCRHCKHTCHRNCSKLRHKLRSCSAFDENGHCEVCPNSCHYKTHYKSSTYFERKSKTVKKQFREYYASNRPYQEIIEDLQDKIDKYEQTITKQSNLLAALNNELQDTALRPLPTDTNAYFDEMIADLNRVQKPGYKELIAVIQKCRDRMKVDRNVMEFKVKLEKAKKDLQDAVGKKDALSRIRKITSYLVKRDQCAYGTDSTANGTDDTANGTDDTANGTDSTAICFEEMLWLSVLRSSHLSGYEEVTLDA